MGLQRLRQRVQIGPRLPVWRLRLVFGAVLMVFSELVMWQNPPARQPIEWPVLYVLYVALAALFLDLLVRFQVYTPSALGLASGVYGLLVSAIIHYTAYDNFPFGLLSRGLGLQVGAGFLALMLFVIVMRGNPPTFPALGAAALTGAAWAIWLHWWPIRPENNWGLVTIESAQTVIIVVMVVVGLLFLLLAPRFSAVRETQFGLLWWELVIVGVPLFVALLAGMLTNRIPFLPLLAPLAIIAFCLWALRYQQPEFEPSILGQITFSVPNPVAYAVLCGMFLVGGALAYGLVTDANSPVGVAMYFIVLGFGTAWLPFASGLILWMVLRTEYPAKRRKRKV